MSKTRKEMKFNEERIKKLVLYAKHDLLRPPYTEKYTEDEIQEAKRRYELTKKIEPSPSMLDSFFGIFSAPAKHSVAPISRNESESHSECKLS